MREATPRDKKSLVTYLRAKGYVLQRTGTHDLYVDGRGHRVTISQGGFVNPGLIKRIILSVERGYNRINGREEAALPMSQHILATPQSPGFDGSLGESTSTSSFNPPFLVKLPSEWQGCGEADQELPTETGLSSGQQATSCTQATNNYQTNGGTEQEKMMLLTEKELPQIRALHSDGCKQKEILKRLQDAGYKSPSGIPLTQSFLSGYMRRHGLTYAGEKGGDRKSAEYKEKNKITAKKEVLPESSEDKLLAELLEVHTSNLQNKYKATLIFKIVDDYRGIS